MRSLIGLLPDRAAVAIALILSFAFLGAAQAADQVDVTFANGIAYEQGGQHDQFHITRSGSTTALTVNFVFSGTATFNADYTVTATGASASTLVAGPGVSSVTIPVGSTSVTIDVAPIDDATIEGSETVLLSLNTNGSLYTIGGHSSSLITIADNDMVATLTMPDPIANEDTALFGTTADFNANRRSYAQVDFTPLIGAKSKNLQIRLSGTATLEADYHAFWRVGGGTVGQGVGYKVTTAVTLSQSGSTTINFDPSSGVGGFFPGDVISYSATSGNYWQVQSATGSSITVLFAFAETGAAAPPFAFVVDDVIQTHFPILTPSRNIFVPVKPGTVSDKVGISIEPIDDGVPEARETAIVTMIEDPNYALSTPTTATMEIADDDVTADVQLGSNASEPSTAGSFLVTLSAPFPVDVTIPYAVAPVAGPTDAVPGVDYVALPGVLTIPAGATSGSIVVSPLNSGLPTGGKNVKITLLSTYDYKLAGSGSSSVNPSASLNIAPSEGVVSITAGATAAFEHPTAPGSGTFTVNLARRSGGVSPVNVNYSIGGTATPGADYVPLTGHVLIPGGASSATITVTPVDDLAAEGNENVFLTLIAGQGYTINPVQSSGAVTILDDEPALSVAAIANASETGSVAGLFRVSYPGVPAGATLNRSVLVHYALSGTATLGVDYADPGALTIPSGSRSIDVQIVPVDDTLVEGDETVIFTLAADPSYSLQSGADSASLTITDNDVAPSSGPTTVKPPAGSVSSGSNSGCGLGGGAAALLALALVPLRRRRA